MILESNLVPSTSTSESKVFYLKMKGDYHRYMAEFKVGDERKEVAEDTMNSYKTAQLPIIATDTELEELIIQHLAAAVAMGRARQIARKESHRNRSSGQGRPHYLVFSTNSNEHSAPASSSPSQRGEGETPSITVGGPTSPLTMGEESGHPNTPPPSVQSIQASRSRGLAANQRGASSTYSDVVEASGTARPGEIINTADATTTINRNALGRPLPTRPWLQTYTNNTYAD